MLGRMGIELCGSWCATLLSMVFSASRRSLSWGATFSLLGLVVGCGGHSAAPGTTGGNAGGGGGPTCGGQPCNADQVCCGPAECGHCVSKLSGANCAPVCPNGGAAGAGGSSGDAGGTGSSGDAGSAGTVASGGFRGRPVSRRTTGKRQLVHSAVCRLERICRMQLRKRSASAMSHHCVVPSRELAGLDAVLRRASSASRLSGDAPKPARHLFGHDAVLLVRRWLTLLVQRLQQRLALPNLPDHRSPSIVLRAPRKRLPSGDAASRHAVPLAGRVVRPRLHADNHLYRRPLAMGQGHVSRLRVAGNADRDAGW